VGANYIEANEALGKKDFLMHAKIFRKEAKESRYWLSLSEPCTQHMTEKNALITESTGLLKIFNAIIMKSS
jgi:four helix bundle protein